jgi:fructuronate reductase
MKKLSAKALPEGISTFTYDRDSVHSAILHFGIGNFHRAHQAVYYEDLLEQGETQWGITGVSLRSAAMRDDLRPQNYLYTLAILGETTEFRCIGAVQDVLVAPEDPEAVVDVIANPATQIVSSTITEKGYYLGAQGLNSEHPDILHELRTLDSPKTIYGYLARGIIQRSQTAPESKLTVMCCDNISSGGNILEQGVNALIETHNSDALLWAETHVSFISSMVDRVCPATDKALRETVRAATGRDDQRPVSAEPFTQWIIEDNFAGNRPNLERVGAVFVNDILPYEIMKLRYLNAAHTITSTLGYLCETDYVHEALRKPEVLNFVLRTLHENILPHASVPAGHDGKRYIKDVISRFQNPNLPYANLQVGTDSSQKIQQRWFPTIDNAVQAKAETNCFQFALAAWVVFIDTALDNGELNDPQKAEFVLVRTQDFEPRIIAYLNIAAAHQFTFSSDADFMTGVIKQAKIIAANGVLSGLKPFSKWSAQ